MRDSRRRRTPAGRARILGWLDQRVNFERVPATGLGLGRMRRLLAALGSPQDRFPVAHVAGTKGKGSTVAFLAANLDAAGHRVGRYMSPHVHAIEERIAVGGRPISAADLVAAFDRVIPAVETIDRAAARRGGAGVSWFEALTAAAFVHFADEAVDIAVLETGLGGRLDATNVSRPLVSVITSISLDHMAVLGPTVGRIAREKAGIIKRGCPVVAAANPPAARRVIASTARRRRAPLLELGRDFSATSLGPVRGDPLGGLAVRIESPRLAAPLAARLALSGPHQAANAALAVAAALELDARGLDVPRRVLAPALASVSLPARIERLGTRPLVVVDAAHNVASMASLLTTLAPLLDGVRPRVLVFAASGDKQIEAMLALTRGRFDEIVVTRYATNPRAATIERLVAGCRAAGLPEPRVAEAPVDALRLGRSLAGRGGLVCVAGSFFLAAEVGRA